MKDTVTAEFTIRVMILCVSVFMASCSGDEPAYKEITNADVVKAEPQVTVVEWYPRPKHLPPSIQPYEVYPHGQQPLMPQPPVSASNSWQVESKTGVWQPARPAPEYVYRDIPTDGSWGRTYQPQQPGLPDKQYIPPRPQYMPRPWGETPGVGTTRDKKSASPAQQQDGTVHYGAWQSGHPGYGYGVYPGYGYASPGWGGW